MFITRQAFQRYDIDIDHTSTQKSLGIFAQSRNFELCILASTLGNIVSKGNVFQKVY